LKYLILKALYIVSLVLSQDDIVKYMVECIKEVNEVIKLPSTTVRLLLHHFRWDKEKLMERFYDPDHQDELFRQARIINPFKKPHLHTQTSTSSHRSTRRQTSSSSLTPSSSLTTTINPLKSLTDHQTCLICCSTKPPNEMTGLECGHIFCRSCWQHYLTYKIIHEGIGQTISCPSKCDILVDDKTVLNLIEASEVRSKYQHLITNSFVECNRNMRWCPGTNCTNAIKASYCDVAMVTCTRCNTSFCFQCGQAWHEPIKCKWLKKWQKKCHDDSETSNWIAANTKECPKCHATIGKYNYLNLLLSKESNFSLEKNGGCNHLICKNQSCKYEFCWVCLGAWEPHGSSWYNCNRFNEDDAKKARDEQDRSRAALQRYLHYYKRYHNHHESLRLENKLLEQVQKRMELMQQQMSWIEVQFLQIACEVLRQCRQTLMYTYPFAFYLKRNNHSYV
jgi:ariadne-1